MVVVVVEMNLCSIKSMLLNRDSLCCSIDELNLNRISNDEVCLSLMLKDLRRNVYVWECSLLIDRVD